MIACVRCRRPVAGRRSSLFQVDLVRRSLALSHREIDRLVLLLFPRGMLSQALAAASGVAEDTLVLAEMYKSKIYRLLVRFPHLC